MRLRAFGILGLSLTSLTAQIPTDGLIRNYPFSGTAMDYSVSDKDGNIFGAMLTIDRFGRVKSAYDFDNSGTDYINFPNTSLENQQYTFSIWANLSSLPPFGDRYFAFCIGSTSGDQVISYANNYYPSEDPVNGWTCHSYTNGSNSAVFTGIDANTDQWYNLVSVRDENSLKLYVNGVLINSVQDENPVYYGIGPTEFSIGCRFNGTLPFHGKIDDVKVYNRAISAEEIEALYMEGINYAYVKVTDTLEINLNLSDFDPIEYSNVIKIFPNPTQDLITINTSNLEGISDLSLRITNYLGQVIFENAINMENFTINLSNFGGAGTYLVNVLDNNNNVLESRKLVLK